MPLTTTYSLDFVKLLDLASVDSAADVTPLFNGGFAGIGDLAGAFSNSRGTILSAQGAQTGTVSGFSGSNGAIDQLSNGNLVIAGEDSDSIVFKIVSSTTGATVVSTVDLGLAGASNVDVEAISSDRFCIVSQRGAGIDVSIRNNIGASVSSFSITPSGGATASKASVCGSNDGSAIVAWQQTELSSQKFIWYKIIGSEGSQGSSTLFLGTNNSSIDRNIETISIPGGFALIYEDWAVSGVAGPTVIRMTRFNDAGAFVGTTTVSGASSVNATHPSATLLQNGFLAVAYTRELSFDSDTVVSLVNPATGAALAFSEVGGGNPITEDVDNPVIASFGLGQLAVFHTNVTDGDADGEHLQAVRTTISDDLTGDTMNGDSLVDVMYGGGGVDTLSGFANNDFLVGGAGGDTAFGGEGNDYLLMDEYSAPAAPGGADTGHGDAGNDLLWGYGGNDNLYGGADNDTLVGNDYSSSVAGTDGLYAGAGADTLFVGLGGNAYMDGGTGNDIFYGGLLNDQLRGQTGSDYLYGNAGADNFLFYSFDFAAGDSDIVYFVDAGDRLKFSASLQGSGLFFQNLTSLEYSPGLFTTGVYITAFLGGGQTATITVYGTTVAALTPLVEYTL